MLLMLGGPRGSPKSFHFVKLFGIPQLGWLPSHAGLPALRRARKARLTHDTLWRI
jgi:hypothetical protein